MSCPDARRAGGENKRLASGRRTCIERARARRRARHQRHELARLVLHDEVPAVCERRSERVPASIDSPSGAKRRGAVTTPSLASRWTSAARVTRIVLALIVSPGSRLLNSTHDAATAGPNQSIHRATSQRGCEPEMLSASSHWSRVASSPAAGIAGRSSADRERERLRSTPLTRPAALDLPATRVSLPSRPPRRPPGHA